MGTTVQSVERAFAILETFDEQHPTRTAAEIAEVAGLARPTTYRMLQTLRRLGYVRNLGGRFEVTPQVLRLAAGYLGAREALAACAEPTLDAISERLGEHVALGVLDGDEVIALAASSSPQSRYLAVAVQVGQRLPAERSSLGRVLLAHQPGADGDEARQIRADGYVVTDGLLESGLRSLGVPVRDYEGEVVAAMSVAVNSGRVSIEHLEQECLPHLRAAADEIANVL